MDKLQHAELYSSKKWPVVIRRYTKGLNVKAAPISLSLVNYGIYFATFST